MVARSCHGASLSLQPAGRRKLSPIRASVQARPSPSGRPARPGTARLGVAQTGLVSTASTQGLIHCLPEPTQPCRDQRPTATQSAAPRRRERHGRDAGETRERYRRDGTGGVAGIRSKTRRLPAMLLRKTGGRRGRCEIGLWLLGQGRWAHGNVNMSVSSRSKTSTGCAHVLIEARNYDLRGLTDPFKSPARH